MPTATIANEAVPQVLEVLRYAKCSCKEQAFYRVNVVNTPTVFCVRCFAFYCAGYMGKDIEILAI